MTLSSTDRHQIITGTHADPYAVLGLHEVSGKLTLRAFLPGAEHIEAIDPKTKRRIVTLEQVAGAPGLFEGVATRRKKRFAYHLRVAQKGSEWIADDAFRFGPVLGELDEHLIAEGAHRQLWRVLGAHPRVHEGVQGVHFAVWAPNASRVSVVGHFNTWDGRRNPMRRRGGTGLWETFIPGIADGEIYKYELLDAQGHLLPQKADPVGFGAEHPPATGSVVRTLDKTHLAR